MSVPGVAGRHLQMPAAILVAVVAFAAVRMFEIGKLESVGVFTWNGAIGA